MKSKQFGIFLIVINFIFTLHFTLNSYINSSFLEQFIPVAYVGPLYTIAAALAIIFFTQAEQILISIGVYRTTIYLIALDAASLLGLSLFGAAGTGSAVVPVGFFIIHYVTAAFILSLTFDLYFEQNSHDHKTGFARGAFLTAANIAWLISPLLFSRLVGESSFWHVYSISFILSLLLLITSIVGLRKTSMPHLKKVFFWKTFKEMLKRKDLFRIFTANFVLQFFFAWMIIYLPIHLHQTIGFSWGEIGLIFTIMLLPYVLLEIPLGYIADRYLGEKELLATGFIIMFLFTIPLGFMSGAHFFLWSFVLFGTRIGSAMVEIMTESYFFKKISAVDGNLISFFRNSQPMAYVAGPLTGSVALVIFGKIEYLFVILAFFVLAGLVSGMHLKDTR